MDAIADLRQALRDVNVEALNLNLEMLMRPSWWPAPSPPLDVVAKKLNVQRAKAEVIVGVFIYSPAGKVTDSALLIGDDAERGAQRDNMWVARILDGLIREKAENPPAPPKDEKAQDTSPSTDETKPTLVTLDGGVTPEVLESARLNNRSCAQIWMGDWGAAQTTLKELAGELKPPTDAPPPSTFSFRSMFGQATPAAAPKERETPGHAAAATLAALPEMVTAYVDLLHARAEAQQRSRSWK